MSTEPWRTLIPTPDDGIYTDTLEEQHNTERELIDTGAKFASDAERLTLRRDMHVSFLARNLLQGFPSRYQGYDASQPWLVYWTVQAFALLQVGMDDTNRQK